MNDFKDIFKKVHFWVFWYYFGSILSKKKFLRKNDFIIWNMLWYPTFMQKKYGKRSNSSKDIAVWEIERSDWSRAFKDISREQEFSRTCGFCRKLANQKRLRFMPFLVKTNGWIFCQSPKNIFLPFFGPFLSIFGQIVFSSKKMTSSYETCYGILPSCKKIQETAKRFKRYSSLRNRAIWLVESFQEYISRIRIFPDMRFSQKVSQP